MLFYNKVTLKSQELFGKIKGKRSETIRLLIPFLMAGFFGFTMPEILGSGHNLVDMVAEGNMMLKGILFLFVMKLFFSCVSFGSGAPGGIFFPLLVLGSLIGALMPLLQSHILGWIHSISAILLYWQWLVILQQLYEHRLPESF